jgi:hypothetical protein
VEVLNKKFQQFGILHHHLSIDEQMIPYRGGHLCKMFIFGKPVKFGYKSWTIISSNGYVYGFEIYSGKGSAAADNNLGMGGNVVINLLRIVDQITQFILITYSRLFRCSFINGKEAFLPLERSVKTDSKMLDLPVQETSKSITEDIMSSDLKANKKSG